MEINTSEIVVNVVCSTCFVEIKNTPLDIEDPTVHSKKCNCCMRTQYFKNYGEHVIVADHPHKLFLVKVD